MSSHRTPSSDRTQTKDLDDGDKENIIRVPSLESVKPELAADLELNVIPSPNAQQDEWVTGFKLFNIIAAVALVTFLMLLDTSIVSIRGHHIPFASLILSYDLISDIV